MGENEDPPPPPLPPLPLPLLLPPALARRPREDSRLCRKRFSASEEDEEDISAAAAAVHALPLPLGWAPSSAEDDDEDSEEEGAANTAKPLERRPDSCSRRRARSLAWVTFMSRTFRLSAIWLFLNNRTRSILRA